METMFSSIKYEVSDEYTEENGTYYVDIKVYPPLWTQSVNHMYPMSSFQNGKAS